MTTTSTGSRPDGAEKRDRELERAIRHALVLAAGRKAANRAVRQARVRVHHHAERKLGRAAAHLAGYATLLGFILYRERAHKHQAA